METVWALIGDDLKVANVIVCDQENIALFTPSWEYVKRIDELTPMPSIGWTYVPEQDSFLTLE